MPTAERGQHDDIEIEQVEEESHEYRARARVVNAIKLDTLHKRGTITNAQHAAGLAFRGLYFRAYGTHTMVAPYTDMIASGSIQGAKFASADAAHQFMRAMREIGRVSRPVVYRVCVEDGSICRTREKTSVRLAHTRALCEGLDALDSIINEIE
jgi:hypothetical protein